MTADEEVLPAGWHVRKIREVTQDVPSIDPRRFPADEFNYIDISSIDNVRLVVRETKKLIGREAPSRARRPVEAGDVVFSNVRTYLRNVARINGVPEPAIASTGFTVLRPTQDVSTDFLFRYVASDRFLELVTPRQTGTHYPATSDRVVRDQVIPLPPLDEQHRIVQRLVEFDQHRMLIAARLAAGRQIVDRLQTAVLEGACSGRLTADWREDRCGVDADDILPESWRLVTLRELIDRIEAGKSVRSEGRTAAPEEWGVIKVSAMSWGHFLEDENKAVTDPALVNPRYEIKPDDLLISRANTVDLVGASVHVETTRPKLLLSDKSLRLVPRGGIDKPWLNLALRSPQSRVQFAERATGTSDSMRNLSQPKILDTVIALPPLEEQREIVRRAKAVFGTADRVGEAITVAGTELDNIMKGALAKAFRGELVQTEAAPSCSTL
jgi:type I restriction enzyme S subunit